MPAFRSTDHALSWAFHVSAMSVGGISSLYPGHSRRSPRRYGDLADLNEWERHAQAAAVIRRVDGLAMPYRLAIQVWYGGDRAALSALSGWMCQEAGGLHGRSAYAEMIGNWVCGVARDKAVRRELRVSMAAAREIRKRVANTMAELRDKGYALVDFDLKAAGLVEDDWA